jgi:hypothetical protein
VKLNKTKSFLAASILSLSCASSCKKNPDAIVKKPPIVEQVQKKQSKPMKRSVIIDPMLHNSEEQAACDLLDVLLAEKPDVVFFEDPHATRDEAQRKEWFLNSSHGLPEMSSLVFKRGYGYKSLSRGVTLRMAEIYSPEEVYKSQKSFREISVLWPMIQKASQAGDPLSAIELYKKMEKISAELDFRRNNRIVETILKTQFSRAVLSIGFMHHYPIQRLLTEEGIDVKPAKDIYRLGTAAQEYEAEMRGWRTGKADEIVIRDLVLYEIAQEYQRRGFGQFNIKRDYAHFFTVASRAMKKPVSLDEFQDMYRRGPSCSQNMIECLKEIGISVPETKDQYLKALSEAGIHGCR